MLKLHNIMFVGLLTFLPCALNAYIDPKLSDAVRKSNPKQLLTLLSKTRLTQDQKDSLLLLAEEVLKAKEAKLARASTKLNKLLRYGKYIKLLLSGTVTGIGAIASSQLYYDAVGANTTSETDVKNRKDVAGYLGLTGVSGFVAIFGALYGIKTFYNICTAKGKTTKRLDAFEVKQILENLRA